MVITPRWQQNTFVANSIDHMIKKEEEEEEQETKKTKTKTN